MTAGAPNGYGMQGGVPPPPPAPIRKSAGANGCLIWSVAGCGVLALVVIIAFAVTMMTSAGGLVESAVNVQRRGTENLYPIRAALKRYRKDHKDDYPDTLEELVPKYLPDDSLLAEDIEYTPPPPDAEPDTVVVSILVGKTDILTTKQIIYVRLLHNEQIVQDQVSRTPLTTLDERD